MTVVTRCHILRLKCTKLDFCWGSAPDPAGGAYSAPQTPQLDLRGPTSKGRGGGEVREGEGSKCRVCGHGCCKQIDWCSMHRSCDTVLRGSVIKTQNSCLLPQFTDVLLPLCFSQRVYPASVSVHSVWLITVVTVASFQCMLSADRMRQINCQPVCVTVGQYSLSQLNCVSYTHFTDVIAGKNRQNWSWISFGKVTDFADIFLG